MEIPEICRLSGIEAASLNCLDAPSFLSRILAFSGIDMLPHAPDLWKWGALLIALVAAFRTIANGAVRVLFLALRNSKSLPLLTAVEEDDEADCSSSEGEGDTCSSPSSSSDVGESDDDEPSPSFPADGEDFRVAGSGDQGYDRSFTLGGADRFSWPDFANAKSVVKLWDSLGVEKHSSSGSPVSLWDLNWYRDALGGSSFPAGCSGIPAASAASPAVIVSATAGGTRDLAVSVWDRRIRRRNPALYTEWRPEAGREAPVNSGAFGEVFVAGDGFTRELTIGDLRKAGSPLGSVTVSQGGGTWWGAGAVAVPNECGGASCSCDSVARRCCDAVRFCLF